MPRVCIRLFAAVLGMLLVIPAALAAPPAAHPQPARASHSGPPSGVYYEIFVRSFRDSNGDGIGDLNGITASLDYLKSLGISGIWLTPIQPSPSYHGYDVTDYFAINPVFGSMADFERLVHAAHARGIRVMMDLVLNHTSDENPWFLKARNPQSPYHDWYVWAGPKAHLDARSAAGGPAWHALGRQHYLGVFSSHMPDLNYDNPAVRREMIRVGRFWLRKGVDGFRLDAARHIYENFASQDYLPSAVAKNVAWWKQFGKAMRRIDPHVYIVGEVTGPTEAQLTPYDAALNSTFDFPLARALIRSAMTERSIDLGRRLARTLARDSAADRSDHAVFEAPFLSNHDQPRVMNDLGGNLDHMRMAAAMLLTLPGHPFLYYGEEIGMRGTKPDPQIREPMRWNRALDAAGETRWEPVIHNVAAGVSVAAESVRPGSLLDSYRQLIHWRKQLSALRDGTMAPYPADGGPIAAYVRADARQVLLVVHNLSGFTHVVKLNPHGPHFDMLVRQLGGYVQLDGNRLRMPPYATAILEASGPVHP